MKAKVKQESDFFSYRYQHQLCYFVAITNFLKIHKGVGQEPNEHVQKQIWFKQNRVPQTLKNNGF